MAHYAAFDVSDKDTAIHVLDEHGRLVWKGKRASEPEVLATALRRHAPELRRVGLETGQLAPWLYHSLKALGVPVVCLDARHARAATALQRNKTDARDAETLAQLVRTGWYREARVKGWAAHAVRHLVNARAQLVGVSTDLSNQIHSVLKTFGLRARGRAGGRGVRGQGPGTDRGPARGRGRGGAPVGRVADGARPSGRAGPQAHGGRQGGHDLPPAHDLSRV